MAETSLNILVHQNTKPEQYGLTLLIHWYLQHAAVNDTKTHGHRHLSSRVASETFAALSLLHTL